MSPSDRFSIKAYISEEALKEAILELRKTYRDSEIVREGIRCLAKREGIIKKTD